MLKRSAADGQTEGQAYPKVAGSAPRRNDVVDEIGEFEDAWEDEIEDEEPIDGEIGQGEDGTRTCRYASFMNHNIPCVSDMDVDEVMPAIEESEEQAPEPRAYIPGSHVLGKDEILEPDDTVYIMRHSMNVTWPCLSFDVLRDNLGDERQRYPATAYIVAGTQADQAGNNELSVHKMSSLHRTQKDGGQFLIPVRWPILNAVLC